MSIVVDIVSHIGIVALAATLFLAFSPFGRSLGTAGAFWRGAEGTILALVEISNLVLLAVAQKYASATGAEADSLESLGRGLILV